LIGTQEVSVELGDVRHTSITAGKFSEARQVCLVLQDSALRGAPIELEPAEILVDCFGEWNGG
jgi:hypothetical protein